MTTHFDHGRCLGHKVATASCPNDLLMPRTGRVRSVPCKIPAIDDGAKLVKDDDPSRRRPRMRHPHNNPDVRHWANGCRHKSASDNNETIDSFKYACNAWNRVMMRDMKRWFRGHGGRQTRQAVMFEPSLWPVRSKCAFLLRKSASVQCYRLVFYLIHHFRTSRRRQPDPSRFGPLVVTTLRLLLAMRV